MQEKMQKECIGKCNNCTLLTDRLAEERKKVVEEIREKAKNEFEFIICDECYNTVDKDVYISSVALTEILDQIEGASDDNS